MEAHRNFIGFLVKIGHKLGEGLSGSRVGSSPRHDPPRYEKTATERLVEEALPGLLANSRRLETHFRLECEPSAILFSAAFSAKYPLRPDNDRDTQAFHLLDIAISTTDGMMATGRRYWKLPLFNELESIKLRLPLLKRDLAIPWPEERKASIETTIAKLEKQYSSLLLRYEASTHDEMIAADKTLLTLFRGRHTTSGARNLAVFALSDARVARFRYISEHDFSTTGKISAAHVAAYLTRRADQYQHKSPEAFIRDLSRLLRASPQTQLHLAACSPTPKTMRVKGVDEKSAAESRDKIEQVVRHRPGHTKEIELSGEFISLEFSKSEDLRRVELLSKNVGKAFADRVFVVNAIAEGFLQLDYLMSLPMSKKSSEELLQHIVTGHTRHDHLVKQDALIQLIDELDWMSRLSEWNIRFTIENILYWMDFDKYPDPRWIDIIGTALRIWPAEHFHQLFYQMRSFNSASNRQEGRLKFWRFFIKCTALRRERTVGDQFISSALGSHCYEGLFRAEGAALVANIETKKLAVYIYQADAKDHCALAAVEDALSIARLVSDHERRAELEHLFSCFDRVQPDGNSRRARAAAELFLTELEVPPWG